MADDQETIELDFDKLTLGEFEEIEDIAGYEAVQKLMSGVVTAKSLVAVAYVIKRRNNPSFTMDDAKKLRFASLKQPEETPQGKDGSAES